MQELPTEFMTTVLDSSVAGVALLILLVSAVGFWLNQRQSAKMLTSLVSLTEGFSKQSTAISERLDATEDELSEERTHGRDQIDKLGEIMHSVAKMVEQTALAGRRQEDKIDQVVAIAEQRLALLNLVVSGQDATNSKLAALDSALAELIKLLNGIDERTEKADTVLAVLRDVPTALETIRLAVVHKIADAERELKRATGTTMVVHEQ